MKEVKDKLEKEGHELIEVDFEKYWAVDILVK